MRLMGL
ncbi:unnamed protein product, partial [Rotaria sp. Silwood1]